MIQNFKWLKNESCPVATRHDSLRGGLRGAPGFNIS